MKIVHINIQQPVKKLENKVISMFKRKAFCLKAFNQLQFTGFVA